MKLYRRGRIWWITFYDRGKRVQESTGTANQKQAEKRYALRLAEIERGEYVKPIKTTLSDFGQQYLEYAKANKRSWLRDQQMMAHLSQTFGSMLLTEITALPIERYKLERVKKVRPATVNREVALLKHLFNVADSWGLFRGRNPVKGIKFLAEDNLQFRTLSEAEEQGLLKSCSPYLQDLVTFAIHTGLRLGDILNLRWEEVNLEDRMIRTLVRKNRRMLEVPLNDKALSVVRGWHGIRKCTYVF